MREVMPYKISYFKLESCKKKFKLGDHLMVLNPNFAQNTGKTIADIFDKLHIEGLEYDYIIDYNNASISIHFGTII